MKKEAILKINKMGKIGQIIAIIANIFMTLGIVAVVGAMILFAVMPNDLVTFQMSGIADVSVNLASIGKSLSEEEQEKVLKELGTKDEETDGSVQLELNEVEYGVDDIAVTEDVINVKTSADSVNVQLGDFRFVMMAAFISILMVAIVIYFVQRLCKAFRYCESPFEEKVIKSMQHLAIAIIPWTLISGALDTYLSSFLTNGGELSFELNLGNLVVCLVIFALTYVFKYGAVLQQESDETL